MSARPEKLGKYQVSWGADGTATVHDVPVFERVSRAGREYDTSWLVGAVNRFADERKAGFRPALHIGHCRDEFDEKPACGFLDRLRVDHGKLFGDLAHVQPETFASLARGQYPYVSVEAWHGKGKLKSVALLGSSPPQIKASPLHLADGFREYETFRERGTGKEPGELVDRFIVRAFSRDGFRAATPGGDTGAARDGAVSRDLFQATKEGLMPMPMPEEMVKQAADEGGDEKIADLTVKELKELIEATILDLLENDGEEGGEGGEEPPAPEDAAPAAFKDGGKGDLFAENPELRDMFKAMGNQITRLQGENRAAKLDACVTQLSADGYTWDAGVLDHFQDVLAGLDESKWPGVIEVLKNSGKRTLGARSPFSHAGSVAPATPDNFNEQVAALRAEKGREPTYQELRELTTAALRGI